MIILSEQQYMKSDTWLPAMQQVLIPPIICWPSSSTVCYKKKKSKGDWSRWRINCCTVLPFSSYLCQSTHTTLTVKVVVIAISADGHCLTLSMMWMSASFSKSRDTTSSKPFRALHMRAVPPLWANHRSRRTKYGIAWNWIRRLEMRSK